MTEDRTIRLIEAKELAAETNLFTGYLRQNGLPTDNVIATTEERDVIGSNLPSFLQTLTAEEKREARYLSKFVGATAVGLFDAALNYIWNEVVLNLRQKAIVYGVDLFFDAAVGGTNRSSYKDESDLDGLKDIVLLNTCLKLELVSEIVYRKLDHILTMRNEVAASHPNVESIGGFELLGWLQTCVKDVLKDRPSDSAIRIKSLVNNLKGATTVVDANAASRFTAELRNLSLPHLHNLLISFFGIFVTKDTDQVLRKNISLLIPGVWQHALDPVKYRIGGMVDGYRTNLEHDKLKLGLELLGLVNGKAYETLPARTVALQNLVTRLSDVHDGMDNYWHEPPIMKEVLAYCRKSTDIPDAVRALLVKVVLDCRLGRGLSYRDGVSPGGKPLYDAFLGMLDDYGVVDCLLALHNTDLNSKLSNPICQRHLVAVLDILKQITIAERLKASLALLMAHPSNAHATIRSREFKELTSPFIRWDV